MTRYLIYGGFGYGSLGDELILSAELDHFGRHNCVVVSHDPAETSRMHEVESISISTIKKYNDYDVFVVGGGGIFYGHFVYHCYDYVSNALKKGKKIQVFNVGVMSDIKDWKLFEEIYYLCDSFTVRNKVSFDVVKEFTDIEPEIGYYPAMYCKKVSKLTINKIFDENNIDSSKTLIGIQCKNVSDVIDFYIPICKYLSQYDDVQLISINTCIHKLTDNKDNLAINTINNAIGNSITQILGDYSLCLHPHEMKALLSEIDLLFSNRKHPALCAYAEGTKSILIDDDLALTRIMNDISHEGYFNVYKSKPADVINMIKLMIFN